MEIRKIKVSEIRPYENNPRKIQKALGTVARSIKEFGFKVPVVLDKELMVIAGHTRLEAAKSLGMEEIPAVVAEDLTEEQAKAYRLADNKTGELAEWDFDRLEAELEEIDEEWVKESFPASRLPEGEQSHEIDLGDFGDKEFAYECPCCGYKFNA